MHGGSSMHQTDFHNDDHINVGDGRHIKNNIFLTYTTRFFLHRLVAILERVQGGLIGQTLSSFGIIGLYITVVLAIGRFLRFSTRNMRMRIQYEDLPTTKRLVTMCQVSFCHSTSSVIPFIYYMYTCTSTYSPYKRS